MVGKDPKRRGEVVVERRCTGRGGSESRQMGSGERGEARDGVSLLRRGSKGRLGSGPRAQRWLDGKELSVWVGERARGVRTGYMGCGACAREVRERLES